MRDGVWDRISRSVMNISYNNKILSPYGAPAAPLGAAGAGTIPVERVALAFCGCRFFAVFNGTGYSTGHWFNPLLMGVK